MKNVENAVDRNAQYKIYLFESKGRVQKPESRVSSVRGGGVPPLSANFFPVSF